MSECVFPMRRRALLIIMNVLFDILSGNCTCVCCTQQPINQHKIAHARLCVRLHANSPRALLVLFVCPFTVMLCFLLLLLLFLQDAHICALKFDTNTSLFAVFDGHGGSEVALYCSQKLPAFLKEIEAYKRGDYEQALKDAFVKFDATLVNDDVIEELKKLIPEDKVEETDTDEEADEDEENIHELCNEGRMPLNELLEKLKDPLAKVKQGESSGTSKPLSPFLRGRRNGSSSGLGGSCSSSGGGSSSGSSATPAASENGEYLFTCIVGN